MALYTSDKISRSILRTGNYIRHLDPITDMALINVVGKVHADVEGKNIGNFGAVILEDEIVVIDSGMIHPVSRKIRESLQNKFNLPILKIVFTHYHSDHVFGAQAFEPVSLIGSASMREICEQNLTDQWKLDTIKERYEPYREERPELWKAIQDLSIRLPDIVFTNKLAIGNESEVIIQHVGGHTAGSSTVVVEPENAIFVGDLIFSGEFPYAGDPTSNPDRWIMNLESIIATEYDYIIPGHGPLCGNDELEKHVEFFNELRSAVKEALNDDITPDEFIKQGKLPEFYSDGAEHRGPSTVQRYFDFYG
ncbi:MAG: MBL fold metallo-hydrolase [Candidatus Thorarchaeota archaeon]|jgi:cyclase